MLGFVFALIALLGFGSSTALLKGPIRKHGVFPAIIVNYVFTVSLSFLAILLFASLVVPAKETLALLVTAVVIGSMGILAFFKAMKEGELSIVGPFAKLSVVVTIAISIFFLSESLNLLQFFGIAVILFCAIVIGIQGRQFKSLEKGILYSLIAVFGWGIFFALLKPLTLELGPFNTTFYVELGIFLVLLLFVAATRQKISISRNSAAKIFVRTILLTTGAIAYNFAISFIGAALTAAIHSGSPAITIVLSRLYLKEKIPFYKYLAIAGIVFGLAILALA